MEYLNKIFKKLDESSLILSLFQFFQILIGTNLTEPGTYTPEFPYSCVYSKTGLQSLELMGG